MAQVNDLKRFKQSDNCVCYLYREIDVPAATKTTVSLGSDDGIAVLLNGKRTSIQRRPALLRSGSGHRPTRSQEGPQRLAAEDQQRGRRLGVLLRATVPRSVLARLDRQLDRDFPATEGEAAYYRIETLPLPEGEAIEVGGLAPSARRQALRRHPPRRCVCSSPIRRPTIPTEITMHPYVRGLHEILGLTNVGNDLYLVQRPEIDAGAQHKRNRHG